MKRLPHIKKPCKGCPMRKDSLKGWLGKRRMEEITRSGSFVCHRDTTKQCAGHMLLLKEGNFFYGTAKASGIDLKLEGSELVFETIEECIKHHINRK